MTKYRLVKYILFFSCLIFLFNGCSAKKEPNPEQERHEALLEIGLKEMRNGDNLRSLAILKSVKDRYPYTKSAIIAHLKLADTYFELDEFDEAFDLYDEFVKFHPKDAKAPYTMFQMGMCHFTRIRSHDQEQEHINKAREMFDRLIKKFPDDEYAYSARKNLRKCLTYLVRYEISVGNFYFKQGRYISALERFTYAIENFPDMGHYHEALENISKCRQKLAEAKRTVETN
ncbi:outer membrane protein assembly factor BamD [Thermodesulfobacteriota bacterium]